MKAEWLLRALVVLAKRELADANATCGGDWPAGQEWNQLGGSSQSVFMHRARERAGIKHDEYLEWVRNYRGDEDLDDIWKQLENTGDSNE